MKTILQINALTVVALLLASCSAAPKPRSAIELFNGTDVSRWDYVLADPQVGKDKVWSVREASSYARALLSARSLAGRG